MSIYPQAAAGQGLYETSDTPKAKLGTIMSFQTDQGVVYARYMQNRANGTATTGSIAAGFGVGYEGGANYAFNTAVLNNASAEMQFFAGVNAASHTNLAYGWVVYAGPVTALQIGASFASSAGLQTLSLNSAGRYATKASTAVNSLAIDLLAAHAILRAITVSSTTGGASGSGFVAEIYWR